MRSGFGISEGLGGGFTMQLAEKSGDDGARRGGAKAKDAAAEAAAGVGVGAGLKAKRALGGDQSVPVSKPTTPLPCPRCESLNTKFCYYNNYSVTQPRHFCRQCQRYWTAGGTLRNVPVGGGSRKKSRQPRTSEPYPAFMQQHHQAQPGMPMPAPGFASQHMFPNVGFHHLMPNPDMASFTFAGHQPFNNAMDPTPNHAMYGTSEGGGVMIAAPLQMLPGGENSVANSSPKRELVENNVVEVKTKNGSSPPHGSSTIEEEGSTPTNGYSNSGYEEGDTVSSMWHEMHDMDNMLFQ